MWRVKVLGFKSKFKRKGKEWKGRKPHSLRRCQQKWTRDRSNSVSEGKRLMFARIICKLSWSDNTKHESQCCKPTVKTETPHGRHWKHTAQSGPPDNIDRNLGMYFTLSNTFCFLCRQYKWACIFGLTTCLKSKNIMSLHHGILCKPKKTQHLYSPAAHTDQRMHVEARRLT